MRAKVSSYNQDTMSRSEAQRRYQNLITYRIRPLLQDRSRSEADKISLMKRVYREANNIRAEAQAPAGPGTREELVDLMAPILKPMSTASEEYKDWIKRVFRSFGAYWEGSDFE